MELPSQQERKKAAEKFQLESFIRVAGLSWVIDRAGNDLGEPDFFILNDGKRIGVEITRLFADKKRLETMSSLKRNESQNLKQLDKLADLYYAGSAIPVRAQFVGSAFADLPALAAHLHELALGLEEMKHGRFELGGGLIVHLLRLPPVMGEYRRWDIAGDHVGWAARVDVSMLEGAIAPKRDRLKGYRQSVDEVVLLLYADRRFASGMITDIDALEADIGDFAAVYLYAFPDQATQVRQRQHLADTVERTISIDPPAL
jgi:hypothetical protein